MILAFLLSIAAANPSPPPEPPVSSPTSIYTTWLHTQGIDRTDVREEPRWKAEGWTFLSLEGPFLDHPAAIGPGGVASRESGAGWFALLGLPVAESAPRAAWLLGNPIPLTPADPVAPGAKVSAPTLVTQGADRVLSFWVAWPPQVQEPYRVVITARPDATVVIDEKHWSEVK